MLPAREPPKRLTGGNLPTTGWRPRFSREPGPFRPAEKQLQQPHEPFERDEVLVCMVLAYCLAGASIDVIYQLVG